MENFTEQLELPILNVCGRWWYLFFSWGGHLLVEILCWTPPCALENVQQLISSSCAVKEGKQMNMCVEGKSIVE